MLYSMKIKTYCNVFMALSNARGFRSQIQLLHFQCIHVHVKNLLAAMLHLLIILWSMCTLNPLVHSNLCASNTHTQPASIHTYIHHGHHNKQEKKNGHANITVTFTQVATNSGLGQWSSQGVSLVSGDACMLLPLELTRRIIAQASKCSNDNLYRSKLKYTIYKPQKKTKTTNLWCVFFFTRKRLLRTPRYP